MYHSIWDIYISLSLSKYGIEEQGFSHYKTCKHCTGQLAVTFQDMSNSCSTFLGKALPLSAISPTLPYDMETVKALALQHMQALHWATCSHHFQDMSNSCSTFLRKALPLSAISPTLPLDMEQWELLHCSTCRHCFGQLTVTSFKTWAVADLHTRAEATRGIITLSEHIQLHKGQH